MYRKTPSDPNSDTSAWNSVRNRIRQASASCRRLFQRYPLYFFAGMLACMIGSGILAFTTMRIDSPALTIALPKPPQSGAGSAIGGMIQTYGALQEIADIQREIQSIIEKDSLGTADSIRLIDALQRFEQLQQPTSGHKNSTP